MNAAYQDYLASDEWRQKRRAKLQRTRRCAICAATTHLDVHHVVYQQNLNDVPLSDLRVVCRRCHDLTHDLLKHGVLVYRNDRHHSRWEMTKMAVKKALGLAGVNMFRGNGA